MIRARTAIFSLFKDNIFAAVQRGIAVMAEDMKVGNPTEETYKNMFGSKQFTQ